MKQAKGIKSPVMLMSTEEHTGLWSSSTAHLKLTEHSKLIILHQKKFFYKNQSAMETSVSMSALRAS